MGGGAFLFAISGRALQILSPAHGVHFTHQRKRMRSGDRPGLQKHQIGL